MSGLMGGSWKRASSAGLLRVPGRCAVKRHPYGLVGTQPADRLEPRQLPTRLRHGVSKATFDQYVNERMAILASNKHGLSGRNWATRFTYGWLTSRGIYRLSGTVSYWPAHARQ